MRDENLSDDRDPFLSQLFADHEQELHDVEFLHRLQRRIELEQRQWLAYKLIALALALGAVALIAAPLMESVMVVLDLLADGLSAIGAVFQSPIAWMVGAALAVAFAPVVYLWRTQRF